MTTKNTTNIASIMEVDMLITTKANLMKGIHTEARVALALSAITASSSESTCLS